MGIHFKKPAFSHNEEKHRFCNSLASCPHNITPAHCTTVIQERNQHIRPCPPKGNHSLDAVWQCWCIYKITALWINIHAPTPWASFTAKARLIQKWSSQRIRRPSYLQFFQGESSARSDLRVVLKCLASHNRTERSSNRSRGYGQSLLGSCIASPLLAAWLVKPCLDPLVPVLVEMSIRNDVVAFRSHLSFGCSWKTKWKNCLSFCSPTRLGPKKSLDRPRRRGLKSANTHLSTHSKRGRPKKMAIYMTHAWSEDVAIVAKMATEKFYMHM